jgi:cell shape-determining protein MreC
MLVGVVEAQQQPVALAELTAENVRLKQTVRELTEKLLVARSETEFFQQRAEEAQLAMVAMAAGSTNDTVLARLQKHVVENARALHLAETEQKRLTEQLQRLVSAVEKNRDVAGEIAKSKGLVEAGQTGAPGTGTLATAQVLDVNPRLQMVVLSAGRQQGVRVGMPFVVLRGDRVVARLKVLEVRRQMSGALVEQIDNGYKLQVGDHVQVTKN